VLPVFLDQLQFYLSLPILKLFVPVLQVCNIPFVSPILGMPVANEIESGVSVKETPPKVT